MPTQAELLQLLPGILRGAGNNIANRPANIDAALANGGQGGQPVPVPALPASAASAPMGPAMSQSQFGAAQQMTPQQQALRQQMLIQALRNRTGGQ